MPDWTVRQSASSGAIERFLLDTLAGSEGGIQVRDALPALERIPEAVWFVAAEGDQILGVYALVPRGWGWWRCHLTVGGRHRDPVIAALVAAANAFVPEGEQVAGGCEDSHVVLKRCLVEEGYQEVAQTEVIAWSKRRADPRVGRARADEAERIRQGLEARGLAWTALLEPSDFLVLRDPELCAGVCVHPLAWHIDSLGPGSRVLLPLLRLGLDLSPLRFGAFLGTFGEPEAVRVLWSAALAHENLRVALVGADVLDVRWNAWSELERGRVGNLVGTSTQRIFARDPTPRPLEWTEDLLR